MSVETLRERVETRLVRFIVSSGVQTMIFLALLLALFKGLGY